MSCFLNTIKDLVEYNELSRAVDSNRLPMGVLGLSHIHKAHFIHSLCEEKKRKALIIVPDEGSASRLRDDLKSLGSAAEVYPAGDFSFRPTQAHSREYEQQRLGVLSSMAQGTLDCVVMSVEAAMQLTVEPHILRRNTMTIGVDSEILPDMIADDLIAAGYVRSELVEGKGQFAIRGGLIDIFPPSEENPVRIELWGETVDSIAYFEIDSQRRTEQIGEILITPATTVLYESTQSLIGVIEQHRNSLKGKGSVKAKASLDEDIEKLKNGIRIESLDRYLPLLGNGGSTIFEHAQGYMLFVCETSAVKLHAEAAEKLMNEDIKAMFEEGVLSKGMDNYSITFAQLTSLYEKLHAAYLDNLPRGSFDTPVRNLVTVSARQLPPWTGQLLDLLEDIRPAVSKGFKVIVFAGTEKTAKALSEELRDEEVNSVYLPVTPASFSPGMVSVLPGTLSFGFEYPATKVMAITYGSRQANLGSLRKKAKKNKGQGFNSLDELHRGDYVVHSVHGIGIFDGIESLNASGTIKDYIKIRYAKDGVLYVPVSQLDLVTKYIGPGSETKSVSLNKLGSGDWQKTKTRVRTAVKEMAAELINLYSKRMNIKGYAFSPDIDMQNDFERRFEFEETDDQLRCIAEIKHDMEKPHPMDRLLCGDVGFGKTEVALRAAFKCVADGKQCAILVPTTLLAMQHYQTIKKRFDTFPIECDMISRYRTPKEQEKILNQLRRGSLDIIVGTHRLISSDIQFKDLGLVIVDEEQRFGVAQKEKLKERFPAVDVLTLSATPIPRTLNMAMTGIRDMSTLEEAPMDRHPVQTYVIEFDMDIIAQAIEREIRRGGQVYYLHNRVEDIDRCAARLHAALPDARIAVGHGKMTEDELSEVWQSLLEGETDVLVCTTIIETGVDVPNANTLIIENADRMGLAQLHQIRGRVGRSSRRASAYFTFTRGKELSDISTRRLEAIREFTEFGSGFKIAMRDLELRGAGNVLGAEQHGHMEAVGYDMYVKLLGEAVSEEKGEAPEKPTKECLIDLRVDAHIPEKYISNVPQKLAMYRRIADIRNEADAEDVLDELIDRFGEPPASVTGLISVSLLRNSAADMGIYEIGQKGDSLILYLDRPDMQRVAALAAAMGKRLSLNATGQKPYISLKAKIGEAPIEQLRQALSIMAKAK